MNIDLDKLNYKFINKPLLIGWKAKEFYGIRKSWEDIDFVISKEDHDNLVKIYPNNIKDLYWDIGICEFEFEIWNNICLFDYNFLKEKSIELDEFLIIGLEKLLFLTALAMKEEKYMNDLKLIVDKIIQEQYK